MFAEPDTWTGGSIDLLVRLGHRRSDEVVAALRTIWSAPMLHGPFADQAICTPVLAVTSIDLERHLYGVASLENGIRVAFETSVVVDDEGVWLYAGLPCGSLGKAYPIGAFPFGRSATEPWATDVYGWLFALAKRLYEVVPFACGMIGWLTASDVDDLSRSTPPDDRHHGYIVEEGGGLRYYSPNVRRPLME
jgi:hypothetical protein